MFFISKCNNFFHYAKNVFWVGGDRRHTPKSLLSRGACKNSSFPPPPPPPLLPLGRKREIGREL
jgi:hypothetical protein